MVALWCGPSTSFLVKSLLPRGNSWMVGPSLAKPDHDELTDRECEERLRYAPTHGLSAPTGRAASLPVAVLRLNEAR
jgi:hypothetical protein